MLDKPGNADDLKAEFWSSMAHSPFVMLELMVDNDSAAPMTAQLDKNADSAIWFFTEKSSRFAVLGVAMATYASKDHKLFARFDGVLVEEFDMAVRKKLWDNTVQAWFPGGIEDPNVILIRMDLGEAAIWHARLGFKGVAKMLLGMDVRDVVAGGYAETIL